MSNNGNSAVISEKRAIKAICDRVSLSTFCSWLSSLDHGEYVLFETTNGIGFIYEVFLPPYMGDTHELNFVQIFSITYPKDTIIQFFPYASENIKPYIDAYRRFHSYTANVDHPEILHEIINKRGDFFEKAAKDGFWTGIKYRPRVFKNLLCFFIPYSSFDNNISEAYEATKEIAINVKGLLEGTRLSPRKFTGTDFKTLLKEILNVGFEGIADEDINREFRNQIISYNTRQSIEDSPDDNTDLLIQKDGINKYVRVYTVTNYPRKMTLWEFNNLIFKWDSREVSPPLNTPFAFSMSVKYADWKKTQLKIGIKAAENIRQGKKNPLASYVPKIEKKAQESQYVNDLIDEGHIPLPSYFSLFLTESSQSRLDYLSQVVLNKLAVKGFEFEREKNKGMLSVFLEMLPLNHIKERDKFLNKRGTLFDANIASMIPFISDVNGSSIPDEITVGRKGGIAFFHRYDSPTNFNMSIVAESGGGKSVNRVNSHVHALTSGRQVRVIEIGRSYEFGCLEFGGEYIRLTEDRKPCFNFFTNIVLTDEGNIHPDELDSIIPLVGFAAGVDISKEIAEKGEDNIAARHASIIMRAVNMAYKGKGRKAGLKEVADAFLEIGKKYRVKDEAPEKLYEAIWPYSHGPYEQYFNGENNIQYKKDYVVLELEEVASKPVRLQVMIIFSLLVHIMREVFIDYLKHGRRTDVDIDEAWMLFMHVVASMFMNSAARRFRKYESSLGVITQGIEDAYQNSTTRAIWDNSTHKIYLQMKHSAIEQAIKENKLVMPDFEKEWFKTLVTHPGKFSEIFFDSPSIFGVSRLPLDRFSYGFFTTTGREKTKLKKIAARYNMNIYDTMKMLTEREPIGQILKKLRISPLSIDLALRYQNEEARDKKLGEILMEMDLNPETLQKALKIQEEQLSWEKVFSS
ncbi:MAG: hypothetical protein A2X55_08880 [Nitrospirae bacterium GWB2_47_37]|nr:MAG: hypothetical protein A2X55_08880 [Nitrospirae bacterium GWB2_47_37]HAK87625.1 hypothetical protein [Nitrospiraceae bacterium]